MPGSSGLLVATIIRVSLSCPIRVLWGAGNLTNVIVRKETQSSMIFEPGQNEVSVEQLVKAAVHNPEAFAELYERFVTPVYRYIYSRTGTRLDAEDLTTQTFMRAMQSLPGLRKPGQFKSWLFTIARNVINDHFRRSAYAPQMLQDMPASEVCDPLATVLEREQDRAMAGLIATLDEDERELLKLRFLAELTYGEIAGIVNRSEQAVKKSIYRLLDRLSRRWEEHDGQK